ncbi:GH36-type glycosyl hydrolase domain-containing protein [Bacillus sp. JJ722]|uniref:GH36-type glycosyl hydrolase domain-containing protein n=1 Tax=Bacillus sp. JJ722 TaxID=3122973 RepID=UPI002FFDABC0
MRVATGERHLQLEQKVDIIRFEKGNSRCEFLSTGDVYQFVGDNILINQYIGNSVDGSANNIYMRVYDGDTIHVKPLLGIKSTSTFAYNEHSAVWSGSYENINYKVTFMLHEEGIWTWNIDVTGSEREVDFIYAQDLGVADKGAVTTNELYMSQYLDHVILQGENGYVISSRQNQTQGGQFPYLQQGSTDTKIIGFSTDGMQFFGKEYKFTNEPVALSGDLPNSNYQFELSHVALQTEKIQLDGERKVGFYNIFKPHHAKAITEIEFVDEAKEAIGKTPKPLQTPLVSIPKVKVKEQFGKPFVSEEFTEEETSKYFANRILEEKKDSQLLSFFTTDHAHVILQAKERRVERPHGHIITSGLSLEEIPKGLITSTSYMSGIFNAQVVIGNTTLNKLLSTPRGLLNIFKNSGQRVYIKQQEEFRLLTMPAAYELNMNYAKWYYKVNEDVVIVTSYSACDQADIILDVRSENGKEYEFIVTNQLVMGGTEFEQPVLVSHKGQSITVKPEEGTFLANTYPAIQYNMSVIGASMEVKDDCIFFEDEITRNGTLLTMELAKTNHFSIVIQGRLEQEVSNLVVAPSFEAEKAKFNALYQKLTRGFHLSIPGQEREDIEKLNQIFWWYTHNAMVHYAVPHGLEQPGGAAWGTRDVCQGPMEYFLMAGHYQAAKKVLEEIFSHQFIENQEWPQWFMFDHYNMQQDDSHGDVVFWPLKALGDYIRVTGDDSILESQVPYRHHHNSMPTELSETILAHVKRAIETISERYLYDTALINYAGGDWDDTLQPANSALKEKLVSSWTVALAYQTIKQLGVVLHASDASFAEQMTSMSQDIKAAFHEYLIKDDVIAGFAYCESADEIEYMLHPTDSKTGINYRLLPMTRSIISELVSPEQAKKNVALIEEHLTFSDGVRLMNRPATYRGGVSQFFQRAEQAANVGREVGLQYVHAHIRFIESMTKLGSSEKAWNGLFTINPINIHEHVPNAEIRQSNAYFSSSDGSFSSRYDFQEHFDKLRNGEVKVKGGWRIYSSGPGIYLNQLVTNILGLRFNDQELIIDPVLPTDLNGLVFSFEMDNRPVTITYHMEAHAKHVERIEVNGQNVDFILQSNPYRQGGAVVKLDMLRELLQAENEISVYLK